MQELKIFEEKQIRTIWDEVQEKWYFCINDVIAALTDSKDPAEYFKKIRRRDSELDDFVRGTNCPPPTNSLLRMAKGILQNVWICRVFYALCKQYHLRKPNLLNAGWLR